ncbi:MAG: hypothetical protein ACI9LM_000691 [Alteromonadaceae bacterium]|jgi:hypothetical protein
MTCFNEESLHHLNYNACTDLGIFQHVYFKRKNIATVITTATR